MPNPEIIGTAAEELKKTILQRLAFGKTFWRPLHARMDYWALMYRMLDAFQQSKPLGIRRFISNDPRTAVDAAVAILTRNEMSWRIDTMGSEDEGKEELLKYGKIERTLQGLTYDLDEMMTQRLLPSWRVQVAQQALLRGMVWGKLHITTEALNYRDSPVMGEVYDARTVYPNTDSFGLNHVIIERQTNLGDMLALYPDKFAGHKNDDPNTPVVKVEYWSNDRPGSPGLTACLAVIGTKAQAGGFETSVSPESPADWIIPPYYHGYRYDALPVFGVAVNGLSMRAMPALGNMITSSLTERSDLLSMRMMQWHGPNSWVAEIGRGILSSVEEHVPQFNELIATIFQHFSIGTYGTWVFRNQTGEVPNWKPGIEAQIALKPNEDVQRLDVGPISQDAYRLVQILQQEKEKGVLSSILQAVTPQQFNSAVLFQQIANAALNAVEPYRVGFVDFNMAMGKSALAQFQVAAPVLKPFELVTPTKKNTYFRVEFDPKNDLDKTRKYRPVPIIKPALPDDLTVRMTAARMALDPRKPMLSLMTVLENILQIDDPAGEMDRIWEDIAQTDPVIVLEQIAQALERRGELEMAARIRENEFRTQFIQDMQFRQIAGTMPAAPGRGPAGGPEAGMTPEQTAPGQPPSGQSPDAAAGAALLGSAMGERSMP